MSVLGGNIRVRRPLPIRDSGALALGVAFSMLIAVLIVALGALFAQRNAEANEQRSLSILRTIEQLRVALIDAETGERGYLLAGDVSYLEPYRTARERFGRHMTVLRALLKDSDIQSARLDRIEELSYLKLAEIQKTIALIRSDRRDEAVRLIRTDIGKGYMDQIRVLIAQLVSDAQYLHSVQIQDSRTWLRRLLVLMTITLGAAALLSIYGTSVLARSAARLGNSERALRRLNETLEDRVAERTEQLNNALISAGRERDRVQALLGELNHRIGNSLQLVSAYVGLQARRYDDPQVIKACSSVSARISAIAAAQRRLKLADDLQTTDTESFLVPVVEDLSENMPERDLIAFDTHVERISISARNAVSISVILLELVTNAAKYAFPEDASGLIRIAVKQDGDDLLMIVEDDGVGLDVSGNKGAGHGIVTSLVSSLEGRIKRSASKPGAARPGLKVTVRFPLSALR